MEKVLIAVGCGDCGKQFAFEVSLNGYESWLAGELIQRAMPELKPEERELFISNTCSTCFDEMFGPPE